MVYLMAKLLNLELIPFQMIEPKKSNYENTVLVGVVNDSQDEAHVYPYLRPAVDAALLCRAGR